MLAKGDKIKLVIAMGMFDNIGEVCEVVDVSNGIISFKFGNGMHLGCMSEDEFNKYFEKYEEPKTKLNTVTEEYIDSLLDEAHVAVVDKVFDKCIIVSVQLKNGFVITESSACVSPDNYDKEIGFDICMNNIKNKLWELEGYRLQCELYNENTNSDSDKSNETKNEDIEKYCNAIGEIANCKLRNESFHCNCPYDCESDCESEFEEKCEDYCKDCPHKETCSDYNNK